jgi:DNA helicase TIP49 (TBP-interacting protein)
LEAHSRISDTVQGLIDDGATDDDLRAYVAKANTDKAKANILQIVRSKMIENGRTPFAIAGAAAAGGTALRSALVNQLNQDGKQ